MQGSRMHERPLIVRVLEPLAASIWILFILWTGVVACVWFFHIGEVQITERVANVGLRAALLAILRALDPAWLTLAALNTYTAWVRRSGLESARRWAAGILAGSILIAWCSVLTHLPLGPIQYTDRLGAKIGPVPFALPLLWIAIVFSARNVAERLQPRADHWKISVSTGLLALLTALNVEPIAWKVRSWWMWYPGDLHPPGNTPISNYVTWWLAATAFAWMLRPKNPNTGPSTKASLVFVCLNGVFLTAHLSRFVY